MAPKGSGRIARAKEELTSAFSMVDMGPISYYLGLQIKRDREQRTIKLSQSIYIEKIVHRFGLQNAKPANTPMLDEPLLPNDKTATEAEVIKYQEMVGSIMFVMIETRPDIAFATSMVSRFAKNPSKAHFEAVKRIIRYLNTTKDRGITFGKGDLIIIGYSDSDWAGDRDSRKSTSGFVFMLNNGPVSWCSKKQATVALSSTEAEYIALTLTAREATWLRLLMTELHLLDDNNQYAKVEVIKNECSMAVKGDNQSAIALANNPVLHARTKHIDIQHHYIRDEVSEGRIDLTYIPTESMIADGLTKSLSQVKFHRFLQQLHM